MCMNHYNTSNAELLQPLSVTHQTDSSLNTFSLPLSLSSPEAGKDFVLLDHVTVGPLGPYTRSRCVAVEIIDDGECERSERFYLSLQSSDPLVSFPVNNAQVVIDGTTEFDDCGVYYSTSWKFNVSD